MKSSNGSPYSKMYLVPPNMYEQLLTCLDDKEKRSAEKLNIEKEKERPAERQVEMLTEEALNPQTQPETVEEIIQLPPGEREETEEGLLGEQEEEIPEEDLTLSQIRKINRLKKEREVRGSLEFRKEPTTCKICLKPFKTKWDLNRHYGTVHKNIKGLLEKEGILESQLTSQEDIPAMLNIQQRQITPQTLADDDTPMPPERTKCQISADTTSKVIPELYFKPPKSGKIIIPEMKKRMQLKGPSFKTKPRMIVPQIMRKPEDASFEEWSEKPSVKKVGTRTQTEAKLRMKHPKYYKPSEDPEYDPDFERWMP